LHALQGLSKARRYYSPAPTGILDRKAAQRFRANNGLTLQWIDRAMLVILLK
jgi:hypothetical protein